VDSKSGNAGDQIRELPALGEATSWSLRDADE
jgi:hypothetical protein